MQYRYETTSLEGFVQYVASNLLPHGYWFYVTGRIPEGKDARAIDRKLIERYGIGLSRQQRARRKLAGQANIQYVRLGRFWVMLATHGEHHWFEEHTRIVINAKTKKEDVKPVFRDVRHSPLHVGGYSLTVRRGEFLQRLSRDDAATADGKFRVRVQIGRERYRKLRAYFLDIATHRTADQLAKEFWNVPFEPYAPVRRQLLNLLWHVNVERHWAGYEKVPSGALRLRRRIVKPFGLSDLERAA